MKRPLPLKIASALLKVNYAMAVIAIVIACLYACRSNAGLPSLQLHNKNEIRVMVIDTGIAFHKSLLPFIQYEKEEGNFTKDYIDTHGHGTHVTGIIVYGEKLQKAYDAHLSHLDQIKSPLCKNVVIYSCKYYDFPYTSLVQHETDCFKRAVKENIDIINYSGGGEDYSTEEYDSIKNFTEQGGLLVTAAGNAPIGKTGQELNRKVFYYPASFAFPVAKEEVTKNKFPFKFMPINGIIPVASTNSKGEYSSSSNWSPLIVNERGEGVISTVISGDYGPMTGTSQAAPKYVHKILMNECKKMEESHANFRNH